jgi:hypothetical protein
VADQIKSEFSRVGMMIDPDHTFHRDNAEKKKGGK